MKFDINHNLFIENKCFNYKLSNGMKLILYPKKNFHQVYCCLTVNYGSLDNNIFNNGKVISFPKGIAHFIEHEIFKKPKYDVLQLFSNNGANANAFTTYDRTCFYFTSAFFLHENLNILLNMVKSSYFIKSNVEKEKKIISHEIEMFNNDLDWKSYMLLLNNLYYKTAFCNDIAGTVLSINSINCEMLNFVYKHFYIPKNMSLFISGRFKPNDVINWVQSNQKNNINKVNEIPLVSLDNPILKNVKSSNIVYLNIHRSKCVVGFKNFNYFILNKQGFYFKLKIKLLLEMLFGYDSINYNYLYNKQIIDETFDYSFDIIGHASFVTICCDTNKTNDFILNIKNMLIDSYNNKDLNEEHLNDVKMLFLSDYLDDFNSLESFSNHILENNYYDLYFSKFIDALNNIGINEIIDLSKSFFTESSFSYVILKNKNYKN